jgi:CheY-like chemotaxis protein
MNIVQPMLEALTILIAEDSAADRMLLSSIVRRQGHDVLTAANGAEAVEAFRQQRPQLVLMDAMMPVMDGFEAARQIKDLAGETLVPIIFLTSLSESEALARCLEAGGDDFLAKPYNQVILAAKIKAMDRLRRLQATVLEQRDQIARHHDYLLNEQRVAKAVFDKVAHSGCLNAPNIRYLQSPYALFNGDLLLAAFTPAGDMHVLLGDFTGHGLPAAVGAMPLAEVFYGMTAKGYGLAETLREMNAKLKRILPVDMFCCATLLNLSFQRRSVEVWNGGMPDGYLHSIASGERTPLKARHLPLGVLNPQAFDDRTEVYPMALGDRVFLLSDGVIDTCDAHERLFGVERLQQVFAANRDPDRLFEEIDQALRDFRGEARDDVSMVEVSLVEAPILSAGLVGEFRVSRRHPQTLQSAALSAATAAGSPRSARAERSSLQRAGGVVFQRPGAWRTGAGLKPQARCLGLHPLLSRTQCAPGRAPGRLRASPFAGHTKGRRRLPDDSGGGQRQGL